MLYPTLAEVLDLPVVRAAAPRVRAGSAGLDVPVRWVHVSEQRDPAGTLTGGELLLSIGVSLADPATDLTGYLAALQDAGAVGLVVELGQHVRSLPEELVQAARARDFPLVELGRSVRFVEITEVVHARILDSQSTRMRFTQRVHDAFRVLAVEDGGAARVLAEAASLTGQPVVLEDLAHRALSFAGDVSPATLLKDWTARSRQVPVVASTATGGPEGWTTTPVGPRARRWGRLVVPRRVLGDDAAETLALVLQHAADALTIGRLLGGDPIGPELEAQGALLQDLLRSTTLDEQALRARARALGLPPGGAMAVVVVGTDPLRDPDVVDEAVVAARTAGVPAVVGRVAPGRTGLVLWCRSAQSATATVSRVAELLPDGGDRVVGAAGPVTAFADLSGTLAEAAFVVDVAGGTGSGGTRRVWRGTDLGARGLLWQLRDDARVLSFVDAELGPLLALEEPARGTMLRMLLAYLDAGAVVTEFARAVRLSRPAAYARLDRLRDLLGRDLDQPRTRLSLHLALLALDQARDGAAARPPLRG